MYAQISTTRQDYVAPRRNFRTREELPTLGVASLAEGHLRNKKAFVLENHDTGDDAQGNPNPPSQVFFFTATPEVQPDGSTIYRADQ